MTIQSQLELRSVSEFDTTTTDGCIEQIVYGFNVVNAGYGIADSALVAYLQIEGNTATTLVLDLKAAGCPMAPSTIRNRCSQLVTKGLIEKTSHAGRPKKAKVEESTEAITEAVIDVDVLESTNDVDETRKFRDLYFAEIDVTAALKSEMLTHQVENIELKKAVKALEEELIGLRKIADKVAVLKAEAESPISSRKAQLNCFK